MKIISEQIGDVCVARISTTSLTASNAKDFEREIEPLVKSNDKIVMEMSEIDFIDSSGIGAILCVMKELSAKGGKLEICSISKPVRSIFELTRLHKILEIVNTKEEALRSFEQ